MNLPSSCDIKKCYLCQHIIQRVQITELLYENGRLVKNVYRRLRGIYGRHNQLKALVFEFDSV